MDTAFLSLFDIGSGCLFSCFLADRYEMRATEVR